MVHQQYRSVSGTSQYRQGGLVETENSESFEFESKKMSYKIRC